MPATRLPVAAFRTSFVALTLFVLSGPVAAETVRVGGTGIGLALARIIGERLQAVDRDIHIDVLPSLGTPGGIKALVAGEIDVAIAARPLKADEQAKGVREAFCFRTALVFASSHPAPAGISLSDLPRLFSDPNPRWPDGQPLKIILRSRDSSENPYLIGILPAMEAAFRAAYARRGIPVSPTDQENADMAQRTAGSFAIMTLLQIRTEGLRLRPVVLDGIEPGPRTLADGRYPMPLPLCLLLPANPAPAAARFIAHLRTPGGQDLIRAYGAEPAD